MDPKEPGAVGHCVWAQYHRRNKVRKTPSARISRRNASSYGGEKPIWDVLVVNNRLVGPNTAGETKWRPSHPACRELGVDRTGQGRRRQLVPEAKTHSEVVSIKLMK